MIFFINGGCVRLSTDIAVLSIGIVLNIFGRFSFVMLHFIRHHNIHQLQEGRKYKLVNCNTKATNKKKRYTNVKWIRSKVS